MRIFPAGAIGVIGRPLVPARSASSHLAALAEGFAAVHAGAAERAGVAA